MKKLLAVGDLHCGNAFGLTPPEFQREDYKYWQSPMFDWFKGVCREFGEVDACVINGDAVDGPGKKDHLYIMEADTGVQGDMVLACLDHVKAKKNNFFFTLGTPYHGAGDTQYERGIAKQLKCSVKDTQRLELSRVRFNFRHTGRRSDTPYGQGTQIGKEVVRDLIQGVTQEQQDADIVCRSHTHYYYHMEFKSGKRMKHGFSLPCLELPFGIYGIKCMPMYYDVGMVLFVVDKGKLVDYQKRFFNVSLIDSREYTKV